MHPSGLFTAWATNWFTNSPSAADRVEATYDGAGQITKKIWRSADGSTNRTQNLAWDARGRLFKVSERDAQTNGFEWTTVFDPLGRRLRTTELVVTNGVTNTTQPLVISQYYDPQVEFLEVAVAVGVQPTWKLHGPDLNGAYGGLNGLGGFDAIVPGPHLFCPVLSDARGNVLAVYDQDHGNLVWNAARPTGYGAAPGYRPPALGHGANLVQASAWRGRWMDVIGSYQIGLRPYNPEAGHWDSPDSLGHDADPALLTFVGGDPINGWDPDGRLMLGMARLDASLSQLSQLLGQANAQSHFAAVDSVGGDSGFALNQDALWQGSVNDGYDQLWSSTAKAARYEAAVDSTRAWYEKTAVDWGMETESRHRQQLSTLLDWTPGVGQAKAAFQTTLGFDLVTGQDVNRGWNAAMVGMAAVPWGGFGGRASAAVSAEFFGAARLEARALMLQGFSRSEAFDLIRGFNAGQAKDFVFHFTTSGNARNIVSTAEVLATQRGLGGPGIYTGTVPNPNLVQRYASPIGWGLSPSASVRIPIQFTPDLQRISRTPILPRWTRIIGEGESIPLRPSRGGNVE